MLNMGFNAYLSQKKWLNPSGFNTSLFGLASQRKRSENQILENRLAPPSRTRAADPAYDFQNLFSALFTLSLRISAIFCRRWPKFFPFSPNQANLSGLISRWFLR